MVRKLDWNVEPLVKISLCAEECKNRVEFEYLYMKRLNIQYSGGFFRIMYVCPL
jgi:hypothetical protein